MSMNQKNSFHELYGSHGAALDAGFSGGKHHPEERGASFASVADLSPVEGGATHGDFNESG